MEATLKSKEKLKEIIIKELQAVIKKYGQDRKSEIVISDIEFEEQAEEEIPDYPVHLFFTREGYFKKITPQSWKMSGEHKLKEGDEVTIACEATNRTHLLFFTDKCQVYKAQASDFDDGKASVLGEYVAAKLGFDEGENVIYMAVTSSYSGYMLFAFENGKIAKVELSSYETKTKRKKLTGAYSSKAALTSILDTQEDMKVMLKASNGRVLLLDTARLTAKTARDTIGVAVMSFKQGIKLVDMRIFNETMLVNSHRYIPKTLPSTGTLPKEEDVMEQLKL